MANVQHIGTISLADADRQTEAIKKIMTDQKLEFGPSYDVLIARTIRHDGQGTYRIKS